jgi:hypothetical protein
VKRGALCVAGTLIQMERITLHTPEALNDGSPVPPDLFFAYEDELYDIALEAKLASGSGDEGFTISPGVIGAWRSPSGERYREPLRLYCLDVVEAEPVLTLVFRLADRIRRELSQHTVYVTVAPIDVTTVTEHVVA